MVGFKRWIFAGLSLLMLSFYSLKGWLGEHLARENSTRARTRRISGGGGLGKHNGGGSGSGGDVLAIEGDNVDVGGGSVRGGGGGGSASTADYCSDPTLERAEYSQTLVEDVLSDRGQWARGAPTGGWHTTVNEACPRFVAMHQNFAAGIGHRLVGYTMAMHIAIWFNATFAHTGLDGGNGLHGNYDGWDAWLGFTNGEHGFDHVKQRPGITVLKLPSLPGEKGTAGYWYHEFIVNQWLQFFTDDKYCNTLFVLPTDQWAYDLSATTKLIMSRKFERNQALHAAKAAAAAAAAVAVVAVPVPGEEKLTPSYKVVWEAKAVNVAVHVRVGDQMPTPENIMTRIVSGTILSALTAVGLKAPVHVHVFAEGKGESDFALFAALPNVKFYPTMPAQETFFHLTQADFLVGSFSSFSWAAGQLSNKPLYFSQPSSDIFRMCGDAAACCYGCVAGKCDKRSGDCSDNAKYRMKVAARRIARLERCGLLV